MKTFACGAVVPGCTATFAGNTDEEILRQVERHAREDHGADQRQPRRLGDARGADRTTHAVAVQPGERTGGDACFLDRLFGGALGTVFSSGGTTKRDYLDRALAGGYPEAMARSGRRRDAWFTSYVQTVVEREAPGMAASPRAAEPPRLLRLVAARRADLLNVQGVAVTAR